MLFKDYGCNKFMNIVNDNNNIFGVLKSLRTINYDFKNDPEDIFEILDESLQSIYDNNIEYSEEYKCKLLKEYISKRSDGLLEKDDTDFSSFACYACYNIELLRWFIEKYQDRVNVIDCINVVAYSYDDIAYLWMTIMENGIKLNRKLIDKKYVDIDFIKRMKSGDEEWNKKVDKYFQK